MQRREVKLSDAGREVKLPRDFSERRRYPRLDFRIPMRYRKLEMNAQEFKGGLMKDISAGGMRIAIYEFLPRDLKLALEIPLRSGIKAAQGTSRVAWIKKAAFSEQYDAGLEFLHFDQEHKTQLEKFIFANSA